MLTYRDDRNLLELFITTAKIADPRVILEFPPSKPVDKDDWDGKNSKRPLSHEGVIGAHKLSAVLSSFGVQTLVLFSKKKYYRQTAQPYADGAKIKIQSFETKEDPGYKELLEDPYLRMAIIQKKKK
jgi:hypothetical protein